MKLLYYVPTFAMLTSVFGTNSTGPGVLNNTARLSNGAQLGVEIVSSGALGWNLTLGPNHTSADVTVKGQAHVGKGKPDVAYIYVIDSSESTSTYDGSCGSVLECVQGFFLQLHNQTKRNGSAKSIAVIDFDNHGWVRADWENPDTIDIDTAIDSLNPGGGTACSHALELTTLMVHQQKAAGTTVVIFAGDGLCNGGDGTAELVSENVTDAADLLGDTGAIVHSIAIGDEVDCTADNDLRDIPRNGGTCFPIPAPSDLPTIIDDLVGTVLLDVGVSVDGSNYTSLSASETGGTILPHNGRLMVDFETQVKNLEVGEHKVCIRATGSGQDKLDQIDRVEDCVVLDILPAPSAAPSYSPSSSPSESPTMQPTSPPRAASNWEIALFTAVCVCCLLFAVAIYKIRHLAPANRRKQFSTGEESSRELEFEGRSLDEFQDEIHQGAPTRRPDTSVFPPNII